MHSKNLVVSPVSRHFWTDAVTKKLSFSEFFTIILHSQFFLEEEKNLICFPHSKDDENYDDLKLERLEANVCL